MILVSTIIEFLKVHPTGSKLETLSTLDDKKIWFFYVFGFNICKFLVEWRFFIQLSPIFLYFSNYSFRKYGHRQCPGLTGDWSLDDSLGDGGHGVPLLEALTYTRCGELLQLGCE